MHLLRRPTAFDGKRRACNGPCAVLAKKHGKSAKLFGRDKLVCRLRVQEDVVDDLLLGEHSGLRRLDLLLDKRRQNIPRANRVDRNAILGKLQRCGLRQAQDAVLCRDIGGFEGGGDKRIAEAILMIRPQLRSFISGTTARMV